MRSSIFLAAFVVLQSCGAPPMQPRAPTPGVPHFRVATYNVHVGMYGDESNIEAIEATGADIVCIQELSPGWAAVVRERYTELYPYQLLHPSEEDGAAGIGVLSKFPLEDDGILVPPNDWHPAWQVIAETPLGRVRLLNVHLRSLFTGTGNNISSFFDTSEDHLQEMQLFAGEHPTRPITIVLGDFNEETSGSAIEYLEDRGFRNVLPLFRPGQGTFRVRSLGDQLNATIDHILFTNDLVPLNARVLVKGNSDHIPVVADFELATASR